MSKKSSHRQKQGSWTVQRGQIFAWILLGAFLGVELINYQTNQRVIYELTADTGMALLMASTFAMFDFGGLARLFTRETTWRREPKIIRYLFSAWLAVAAFNMLLSWWYFAQKVSIANPTPPPGAGWMLVVIPVILALVIQLVRVLVIALVGRYWDEVFATAARPRPARQTRPQPQRPDAHRIFDERVPAEYREANGQRTEWRTP